ncbi:hypothetical protein OCU04_005632 [Sclerotinia nivalis]|uniref:Uncharacterized protein n=1 Tax=Sclerotinia nivalis TaxID=352851 RepID=A0A9X0ASY8_9HELO|nr:hypothetical protein OCU04_005632 [Sclerotinia nivalis]
MPPMPGQKGTGKKGRDPRQSRSRNTTPSLVGASSLVAASDAGKTPYTQIPINILRTSVADEIAEQHTSTIPNSRELEALMQRMERLASSVDERAAVCDKGMRVLAQSRKERNEELEIEKRDEDLKERMKRDVAEEEERGRHKAHKIKKRKDVSSAREERPLTHGAHGLAPQDGSNLGTSSIDLIHLSTNTASTFTLSPLLLTDVANRIHLQRSPCRAEIIHINIIENYQKRETMIQSVRRFRHLLQQHQQQV